MFRLAWRYVLHHRLISALLVAGLTLVIVFPLVAWRGLQLAKERYGARAAATPLLVGRKTNPYTLVIRSLYFEGTPPPPIPFAQVETLLTRHAGLVVPLYMPATAGGFPVVGLGYEYWEARGLALRAGRWPALLGECVLGAEVAERLGRSVGDTVTTDPTGFLDIAHDYPFRLSVCGVLARTAGPDDRAVFVDLKSAWVIAGFGHGHAEAAAANGTAGQDTAVPMELSRASAERIERAVSRVLGRDVVEFRTVTAENIRTFHFHGRMEAFPVHAALVFPRTAKDSALLKASVNNSDDFAALAPADVVGDLLRVVFNAKKVFDGYFALVILATSLFLTIIVLLSLRARRKEFALLARLGCGARTVFTLFFFQFAILFAAGLVLSLVLSELALLGLERYLP